LRRRRHRHRVACPDIRDTGGENELVGIAEQAGRMRERFAPNRLGDPERAVSEPLSLLRQLDGLAGIQGVEKEPTSKFADIHRSLVAREAQPRQASARTNLGELMRSQRPYFTDPAGPFCYLSCRFIPSRTAASRCATTNCRLY